MNLQKMIPNYIDPKSVKALMINLIGFTGLIIAVFAILLAQDQSILLNQIGYELIQSPLGVVLTTVTTLF